MRIVLGQLNPIIGDIKGNLAKVLNAIEYAKSKSADIILFPELTISGYPPEDLLLLPEFIKALERSLEVVKEASKGITVIIGTARVSSAERGKKLFNSATIFSDGKLLGYQDKFLLPTYDVFEEARYFEPTEKVHLWDICNKKVAITICEDIWQHSFYHRDPIEELKKYKVDLMLNMSASPFSPLHPYQRLEACKKAAIALNCPVLLCNQVGGNDSLVFDGHGFYVGATGELLGVTKGFTEDVACFDLTVPAQPISFELDKNETLYSALVLGVRDYFHKSGFSSACVGLSGGIDSAVVAAIAAEALGSGNLLAVIMPSRYTSPESNSGAEICAKNLKIPTIEIPIEDPYTSYLNLMKPIFTDLPFDITEENLQARIRGTILMAISNKKGYIVLSTGNKSELAMGYATLYGDMCGGLAVISDLTKKQIYALARWINREKEIIPQATIDRAPSAELRPNQKDTDTLPEYDIIDHVVEAYLEDHRPPDEIARHYNYPLQVVEDIVKRIHRNEYKRRQSAPGLRVSEKAFSVGRRFPIVQKWS